MPDTSSQLAGFARAVADILGASHQTVYSYRTSLDGNDGAPTPAADGVDGIPVANLSAPSGGYIYTDCSGWMAFALDSVAPLHQAVAATARMQGKFNHNDFDEAGSQGLARAFVLADLFKTADGANGFAAVTSFADLRAGDVIAYALGAYADPADNANGSGDTGHTMILVGTPQLVTDPGALDSQYGPSPDVVAVYAVPIVDSSRYRHFTTPQDDNRHYASTPDGVPSWLLADDQGYAGGTGTGTLWFGLDAAGDVVQWRFDSGDNWNPPVGSGEGILVGTARLTDTIDLSNTALDAGWLDVRVYPNASPTLNGTSYAAHEVLTGTGNVWVTGGGTLRLDGGNSYVGTTEVDGGTTIELAAADSLGDAGNTLNLDDGAVLRFGAAVTLGQDVWLEQGATVDLAGHLVQLAGNLRADGATMLTLRSSTAGGELRLANATADGDIAVGGGTTLSFTGTGTGVLAHGVTLDAGASLHVHHSSTLPQLLVSGAATLELEGATLTLSSGIASGDGYGSISVTGTGSLVLMQGGTTEATLASGTTLFVGTLAQLGGQTLAGFKAGDRIDVTDLLPTATPGVTAMYDDTTGQLTVTQGGRSAVLQLPPGLTDAVADPNHPGLTTRLEFTVRTDGEGGSLIGTATASAHQVSTALRAMAAGSTGAGIVVGVISDSYDTLGGAAQDFAHGYLPQAVNVLADSPTQAGDEGREMARVIHDVAPGATVDFVYDGFRGDAYTQAHINTTTPASQAETDLAHAILRLVEAHATVIVDDIGLPDGRSYQPGGVLSDAIAYAYSQGVTLLTSAGNQGGNYYENSFTLGQTDALPGLPGRYAYAFNPGETGPGQYLQELDLTPTAYGNVPIKLSWDQPAQASAYALNVKVYALVDGSYRLLPTTPGYGAYVSDPAVFGNNQASREVTINDVGNGGTFYVAVTSATAASGTFKFVVNHQGGSSVIKNAVTDPGTGTISGHALDVHEIAVGAVDWDVTPAYGYGTFANEAFSAVGPGRFLFEADGTRLSASQSLGKPDLDGVDGAANDAAGTTNAFFGTSAAAPSVAGVVALLLSANPGLTQAQVRAALVASALPLADRTRAGAGLVQADAAVALARMPAVTAIAAVADAAGPLGAGHTVTLTLTTSVALAVTAASDGRLPILTLDDGGVAILDTAASAGTSLVFRAVVAAGQSSAGLTVTGLSANGATLANAAGVALPGASLGTVPGAATGIAIGPGVAPPSVPSIGLVGGDGAIAGLITNGDLLHLAGRTSAGATVSVSANGVAGSVTGTAGANQPYAATVAPSLAPGLQQVALSVTASNAAGAVGNTALVGVDRLPGPVDNVSTGDVGSFDLRQLLDKGYAFDFVGGTQAVRLTNGTLSVGTDTNQAVVQRLYQGLLLRSADPAGLAGFAQMLAGGTGLAEVAGTIMASAEYARLPGTDDAGFIGGAYAAFTGRAPTASELSGWTDALGHGTSRATAAAAFATAAESKAHLAGATADLWAPDANGALVTQLYMTGLGRNPELPAVSAWTAQIGAGLSPQQLAQEIAASPEFSARHNGQAPENFVSGLFASGLGRAPGAAGLQGWTGQLRAGAAPAAVLLGIATSPEAYLHLSPTI